MCPPTLTICSVPIRKSRTHLNRSQFCDESHHLRTCNLQPSGPAAFLVLKIPPDVLLRNGGKREKFTHHPLTSASVVFETHQHLRRRRRRVCDLFSHFCSSTCLPQSVCLLCCWESAGFRLQASVASQMVSGCEMIQLSS